MIRKGILKKDEKLTLTSTHRRKCGRTNCCRTHYDNNIDNQLPNTPKSTIKKVLFLEPQQGFIIDMEEIDKKTDDILFPIDKTTMFETVKCEICVSQLKQYIGVTHDHSNSAITEILLTIDPATVFEAGRYNICTMCAPHRKQYIEAIRDHINLAIADTVKKLGLKWNSEPFYK